MKNHSVHISIHVRITEVTVTGAWKFADCKCPPTVAPELPSATWIYCRQQNINASMAIKQNAKVKSVNSKSLMRMRRNPNPVCWKKGLLENGKLHFDFLFKGKLKWL